MPSFFQLPPYKPVVNHCFGQKVWLVGSEMTMTVFPACVEFDPIGTVELLSESQFVKQTTFVDLLRNRVTVEGPTQAGFQRLEICAGPNGVCVTPKKRSLEYVWNGVQGIVPKNGVLELGGLSVPHEQDTRSRLVLTSPNCMDWELLQQKKRWQSVVEQLFLVLAGKALPHDLITTLTEGFEGVLVPRLKHEQLWGKPLWHGTTILETLGSLKAYIRSCLVQDENATLTLLPCPLPDVESGQLLDEPIFNEACLLCFDFRKERVRRVLVKPMQDIEFQVLTGGFTSCRVRVLGQKKVQQHQLKTPIIFTKDKWSLLDKFVQ